MAYWAILLFFASLVAGVFALLGSGIAKVLLIAFTVLCAWTLWRARHARARRDFGPDS